MLSFFYTGSGPSHQPTKTTVNDNNQHSEEDHNYAMHTPSGYTGSGPSHQPTKTTVNDNNQHSEEDHNYAMHTPSIDMTISLIVFFVMSLMFFIRVMRNT